MTPFKLFILTLACFRIQRIFTEDSWYFTQNFRRFLNRRALPAHKARKQNLWTELAELFSCPWCFGFWTTIVVLTIDHYLQPSILIWSVFAVSGLVGLIASRLDDEDD